jgi:hypothetical protein
MASEKVAFYSFEKEVEGFHYKAEVYPSVAYCAGLITWNEVRANIKITIYDK